MTKQCLHLHYPLPSDCPRKESCMYHLYMPCPYLTLESDESKTEESNLDDNPTIQ